MLYVFYVDVGVRLTFDMSLVNERVAHLKHVIEEHCDIPANKQVLLVSGGACLDDSAKVCNYPAGTDTNPIYLFNRLHLEKGEIPNITPDYRYSMQVDFELNKVYESVVHSTVPATIYTINKINNLAQRYMEQAVEIKSHCDQLNSDLSLQQQGLAVAVANLDDVLTNFKNQCESFDAAYNRYLETREENIKQVERCFELDLKLLSQIPLLPALLDGNEEERNRVGVCLDRSDLSDLTLLNWISTKDPKQNLENVIQNCRDALIRYDENALISFKADVDALFYPERFRIHHNNSNSSEVSEKLMTVSGILVTIETKCNDQKQKAHGIKRNHDRAAELKEDCILPDLLETHRNTLKTMKDNHSNLRSCKQLCHQAKKEFSALIHQRLKDIMAIQEQAAEIQAMLKLHGGFLKRIRNYMQIVDQLHKTPRNFLIAVSEVVRRRSYSQAFLMWASDVAVRVHNVYTEETERRKKFLSEFDGHFLTSLFPGLQDMPPAFATQTPPLFDNFLPALSVDDMKLLCDSLPQLTENVELPNVEAIRNFFVCKSLTFGEDVDDSDEKVGQQKLSVVKAAAGTNDYSSSFTKSEPSAQCMITSSESSQYATPNCTIMNDSLVQIDRINHEKDMQSMRQGMAVLGSLTQTTMISMRNDLSALRSWVFTHQSEIGNMVKNLHERTQQQNDQIANLRETLNSKDDHIKNLLTKISQLELEKMERENAEKEMQETMTKEREKAIKEVTETLIQNHKQEIEGMRQRSKLMACANIVRYPSETSLEKVEGASCVDLVKHEQLIGQLRMNMEIESGEALQKERIAHQNQLKELEEKYAAEKAELEKSIRDSLAEEHSKQVEMLKTREASLLVVMQRHRDTIQTLASLSPDENSHSFLSRIEELESEKRTLEMELVQERETKYSLNSVSHSASTSIMSESSASPTSLISNPELPAKKNQVEEADAQKKKKAKKRSSLSPAINICLQKLDIGDKVLVVWDEVQRLYTILQDSSIAHFLHPASIDLLGLRLTPDGEPIVRSCAGEIIEKETCRPKRKSNRYNLEQGQTFIRVKVKPVQRL